MFGNTPLTAGQKGVALALPFLKVCSFGACSYVLWVPSSTWPVVLRWVQHNLLITAQTLAVQLGDSPGPFCSPSLHLLGNKGIPCNPGQSR